MSEYVLVTGGCGFIGSHFVRLQLQNYPQVKVINIDKLGYSSDPARLRDVAHDPRYTFIKADIRDKSKVLKALKRADFIVNFAAETHVDNSIKNPVPFIESNILGTFQLLEGVRMCPRLVKFVQVSTDEVYGPILDGYFKEDAPLRPSNPYSASKAAADSLAYSYFVTHRLPVTITRTTNNYGSGQFPEKVIPVFVKNALAGRPLPVYGDGLHKRCWIHARDHCSAIDLVMRKGIAGEIYHVAGDTEITNLELAKIIVGHLGKPETLIRFIDDFNVRPGHDRRYSLDASKIRSQLGWKPVVDFEKGIRETVDSYKPEAASFEHNRHKTKRRLACASAA
ncbi:MAG: dTDP-glucose 4,6-dehydratase [Elusimicrobia bacterium]|nr:dTDP-glucose 4,6-dehydratase [Elusimicrobiota bacterium]